MKAQELRIGNFCAWGYLDKTIYPERLGTIWNITNKSVLVKTKTHKHTVGIDRVMPIPLTEEWLVKFGFEYDKICGIWNIKNFSLDVKGGGWVNTINGGEYDNGIEFYYIHQLQNLYFALTGEELTINKKSPTI